MHIFQRPGDAEHEAHEVFLRKRRAGHEIRVDGILQVAALVVRQEDVHSLGADFVIVRAEARPRLVGDAVVNRVYDIAVGGKQRVCLDFLQCARNGLLPEGTSDFLQGEKLQ